MFKHISSSFRATTTNDNLRQILESVGRVIRKAQQKCEHGDSLLEAHASLQQAHGLLEAAWVCFPEEGDVVKSHFKFVQGCDQFLQSELQTLAKRSSYRSSWV